MNAVTYDPTAIERLLNAVLHPETVEGYNPLEARAAEIEDALQDPFISKETAFTLLEELAEIEIKLERE